MAAAPPRPGTHPSGPRPTTDRRAAIAAAPRRLMLAGAKARLPQTELVVAFVLPGGSDSMLPAMLATRIPSGSIWRPRSRVLEQHPFAAATSPTARRSPPRQPRTALLGLARRERAACVDSSARSRRSRLHTALSGGGVASCLRRCYAAARRGGPGRRTPRRGRTTCAPGVAPRAVVGRSSRALTPL